MRALGAEGIPDGCTCDWMNTGYPSRAPDCPHHGTRWYAGDRALTARPACGRGGLMDKHKKSSKVRTPPCSECGTVSRGRSACPLCGEVFCQRCAEKPYAFCCDVEVEGRR